MVSSKLNEWIQGVGIFAVVASLIFVGMQLKQTQEIAASQAFQSRADSTINLIIGSAENPLFASARVKWQSGNRDQVTPEETVVMWQYATALLYLYENQYYQYVNGFAPEGRWIAAKATLTDFLAGELPFPLRPVFESRSDNWSTEFGAVVNQLIADIDSGKNQ